MPIEIKQMSIRSNVTTEEKNRRNKKRSTNVTARIKAQELSPRFLLNTRRNSKP